MVKKFNKTARSRSERRSVGRKRGGNYKQSSTSKGQKRPSSCCPSSSSSSGSISSNSSSSFSTISDPDDTTITLEAPIKSPNDPKDYRVIQLQNGIKAILVSNMPCAQNQRKLPRNTYGLDTRIAKFNKDILGIGHDVFGPKAASGKVPNLSRYSAQESKKHADNCRCHYKEVGVALNVGCGHYNSPLALPGLAHLLEHVVFCGSAKYPSPTDYMEFMNAHKSEHNGYTMGGETIYYFRMKRKHLREALDRFSDMIKSPCMNIIDIEFERDNVDAEFHGTIDSEDSRILSLLQMTGKKDHPANTFFWGSEDTLAAPDGNDGTLLEIVHKFWHKYYGAENMTLAVEAPEPLDTIQALVKEYFADIPKSVVDNKVKSPLSKDPFPFDTNEFRKWYHLYSVHDVNTLVVTWELPVEIPTNYEAKPLKYIARLVESKDSGSLTQFLRNRNLATTVQCMTYASDGQTEHFRNGYSALILFVFEMNSPDTETAFQVLSGLFSYLQFLEQVGPQEWYFKELQQIQALHFHFISYSGTENLSQSLKSYPTRDCVIGSFLSTIWDPEAITSCLKLLSPERANVIVLSKAFAEAEMDIEIPHFKAKCRSMDIPRDLMDEWKKVRASVEFELPCRNIFITTDFRSVKVGPLKYPVLECGVYTILENDAVKVTLRPNRSSSCGGSQSQYFRSSSMYEISLWTSTQFLTCQNEAMVEVWTYLLNDILPRRLHGATESHLFYDVSVSDTFGINIVVRGFSQNLHIVIDEILQHIRRMENLVDDPMFSSGKRVLLAKLKQTINPSQDFADHICSGICFESYWTAMDQYNALLKTTFQDFQVFCKEFKARLYAEVRASGNVNPTAVLSVVDNLTRTLKYLPLDRKRQPPRQTRSNQLPVGQAVLSVRSRNNMSKMSSIWSLYQIPVTTAYTELISTALTGIMYGYAFSELRTNENLGYSIHVFNLNFSLTSSIVIRVDCESDKHTGSEVRSKIEEFVTTFYAELKKLTLNDVSEHFPANCPISKKFKKADLLKWYRKYFLPEPDSEIRKLTVQVVGYLDTEFEIEIVQDFTGGHRETRRRKLKGPEGAITLSVLVPTTEDQKRRDKGNSDSVEYYITNIIDFRLKLYAYPDEIQLE